MDIFFTLKRVYRPMGTNGVILRGDSVVCRSIELSWRNNQQNTSCIPEGTYALVKRFSLKRKWHLMLRSVPNRKYILIHPANNAQKELRGCIAIVKEFTGAGQGTHSREATQSFLKVVFDELSRGNTVYLTIQKL
jgi:hypothetical protein